MDVLHVHQNMFFQTDEIDGILQSINKAKDVRHESIMNTLFHQQLQQGTIPTPREFGASFTLTRHVENDRFNHHGDAAKGIRTSICRNDRSIFRIMRHANR